MDRFPSRHGARVVFDPIRSDTPMPRAAVIPRAAAVPRDITDDAPKSHSPSFAEIDVVEADLDADPRYDRE